MMSSALALSLLASLGLFVGSFAQLDETNMTGAANETGTMENQTEQGPLEQLGEIFGFGGGNQSE